MNVSKLREQLGWSQQRLADELGVSRVTVARWETGKSSPSRKARGKLNEIVTNEDVTTVESNRAKGFL